MSPCYGDRQGKKAATLTLVRGFRRGNNANNTNLSPLYVNANNAPSNANTNIAFGNWSQTWSTRTMRSIQSYHKSSIACGLGMKRQVWSLADEGERNIAGKEFRKLSRPGN